MDNVRLDEAVRGPPARRLILLGGGLVRLAAYSRRKRALTLA